MGRPRKDAETVVETPMTSTMPMVNPVLVRDESVCLNKVKDLESRIHEIECFRNTGSIEGKIRDLGQQIEDIRIQIDRINGLLNKAFVTKEPETNERILKASMPRG